MIAAPDAHAHPVATVGVIVRVVVAAVIVRITPTPSPAAETSVEMATMEMATMEMTPANMAAMPTMTAAATMGTTCICDARRRAEYHRQR